MFYWSEDFFGIRHAQIISKLVHLSLLLVVVNYLGYYWFYEYFTKRWGGRISIGYPTCDVVTLNYSLVAVLLINTLEISVFKRVVYALLLIAGIMMNFSGTGTIILIFIFAGCIVMFKDTTISVKYLFIILMITLPSILIYVLKSDEYSSGVTLLEAKFDNITGNDEASSNTLAIRENQAATNTKKYNYSDIRKMFGLSICAFTRDSLLANKYMFCENMFECMKIGLGYFGLLLFLLIPIQLLYRTLRCSTRQLFGICSIVCGIYLLNNYTVCPMIMIPNIGYFAVFYAYIAKQTTPISIQNAPLY